jgi:hypothetical protein
LEKEIKLSLYSLYAYEIVIYSLIREDQCTGRNKKEAFISAFMEYIP